MLICLNATVGLVAYPAGLALFKACRFRKHVVIRPPARPASFCLAQVSVLADLFAFRPRVENGSEGRYGHASPLFVAAPPGYPRPQNDVASERKRLSRDDVFLGDVSLGVYVDGMVVARGDCHGIAGFPRVGDHRLIGVQEIGDLYVVTRRRREAVRVKDAVVASYRCGSGNYAVLRRIV